MGVIDLVANNQQYEPQYDLAVNVCDNNLRFPWWDVLISPLDKLIYAESTFGLTMKIPP